MNDAKITIIGHLTKDPTMYPTDNGQVLVMNVAVQTKRKENGVPVTNYYNVTARNAFAEMLNTRLQKGTKVFVTGDFYTEARIKDNTPYTRLNIDPTDIRALNDMNPVDKDDAARKDFIKYLSVNIGDLDIDDLRQYVESKIDPTE